MRKNIYILLFFILISTVIFSENKYNIINFSDLNYKKLCGVYISKNNYNSNFKITSLLDKGNESFWSINTSWGYSYWLIYDSIKIDIVDKNLIIEIGVIDGLEIKDIKVINENKYEVTVYTEFIEPKKDKYILNIDLINDKILKLNGDIESGEYLKIGGPDIKFYDYYYPTIDNLRLRDKNNFDKIIKVINKSDKIAILKISGKSKTKIIKPNTPLVLEKSTIDGKKGYWVEVQTENGEAGICFSGYLKRINECDTNKSKN